MSMNGFPSAGHLHQPSCKRASAVSSSMTLPPGVRQQATSYAQLQRLRQNSLRHSTGNLRSTVARSAKAVATGFKADEVQGAPNAEQADAAAPSEVSLIHDRPVLFSQIKLHNVKMFGWHTAAKQHIAGQAAQPTVITVVEEAFLSCTLPCCQPRQRSAQRWRQMYTVPQRVACEVHFWYTQPNQILCNTGHNIICSSCQD